MRDRMPKASRNVIPYLALLLVLVVGAGGGYALAASNNKTITVCADKSTGILHLKTRGRCKSSQTRVTWNQQGPPGPQGASGGAGRDRRYRRARGAGGPGSGWCDRLGGRRRRRHRRSRDKDSSVQELSTGAYQVTVTDPNAPRE